MLREQPGAEVFIRHDQRRTPLSRARVEQAGGRLVEDGLEVGWGTWGYLQALMGGLGRIAEELDPDWAISLSGQDYPLCHHTELESFLDRSGHDAHLASMWKLGPLRLDGTARDEFVLRYGYRHFRFPVIPRRLPRRVLYRRELPPPLEPLLGVRRAGRRGDSDLYVSADWPTVSRRALAAVLDFPARRPDLMRLLRRSVVPSEALFATALMNEPGVSVGTEPHRYSSWPAGEAHPRVLTQADLAAALASGAHFARKFDTEVDPGVLDELDRLRWEGPGRASLGRPWPVETSESP